LVLRVVGVPEEAYAGNEASEIEKTLIGGHRKMISGSRRGAGLSPKFAFHIIERRVTDVLSVDHIDHVLADVLGVVADSLQRAHHPHYVQRAANRAGIFHHESD